MIKRNIKTKVILHSKAKLLIVLFKRNSPIHLGFNIISLLLSPSRFFVDLSLSYVGYDLVTLEIKNAPSLIVLVILGLILENISIIYPLFFSRMYLLDLLSSFFCFSACLQSIKKKTLTAY